MADIIQAVKWMDEGLEVTRECKKEWGYRYRLNAGHFEVYDVVEKCWVTLVLVRSDILANDWEIAR